MIQRFRQQTIRSDNRPILQVGTYDAEATCAAMILRSLGRFATPEELTADLTYSRNQTDFDAIVACLATKHVTATQFEASSPADFKARLPALIAHEGHLIVACEIEGDAVMVNDPREGRAELTADLLADEGPMQCVSFARADGFEPRSQPSVWSLVKPYMPKMAVGQLVVLTLVVQAIVLGIASMLGQVVDVVLADDSRSQLIVLAVIIAGGALGQIGLRVGRAYMLENVRYRLELTLADSFVSGLQAQGVALMRLGTIGDYTERLQSLSMFQGVISVTLVSLFADGLMGLVFLIALTVISPPLVVMAIVLATIAGTVAYSVARRQIGVIEQQAVQQGRATSSFMELVSSADSATVMGLGKKLRRRWFAATREAAESDRRINRLGAVSDSTSQTITTITQLALFVGIWLFLTPNPAELGQWLSTVALAAVAVSQLIGIAGVLAQLGSIRPLLWRVRGSLEALDPNVEDVESIERSDDETFVSVTVNEATVTADGGRTVLFEADAFACLRGEVVGIAGPSGSGKSTFLLGLASQYGISEGGLRYHYDAHGIPKVRTPQQLAHRLGFVPQTAVVHNMSLADFVRAGRDHLTEADLRFACDLADLHAAEFGVEDVLTLQLGELGSHISGGQRQRAAIARALANRPDLIFLDEATNTIGEHQERELVDRLRQLGVSVILVSHRSSTLDLCDRLYRIEGHELVVTTSHAMPQDVAGAAAPADNADFGAHDERFAGHLGGDLVGASSPMTS